MCKYCEIDKITGEAKRNCRKNQRITVNIVTNMCNENVYYLRINPRAMTGECIDINYCPMCGRRLSNE